jgi:sulfur-oxidizing protein SoxA
MNKQVSAIAAALLLALPLVCQASPRDDQREFREYYMKRFPGVPLGEFTNGVYAIDADSRAAWKSIEEFPPYQEQLLAGEKLFNTPFANGRTYAGCFRNGGRGIRQNYPWFDPKSGEIKTLEMEINECREKNGEQPLDYKKGDMAAISAWMASTSNGKKLDIKIPKDPRAIAWYEKGKQFFNEKRGQLNLSCADCHMRNAGNRIRADLLGPALGHPAHFPAYRTTWGELGTLHWRYAGCNEQVRAKPFAPQSAEYRALEYFQSYMSNGVPVSTPSSRK